MHFRLLGTNGFHVKAKNERFTAASSRCRQNLKYENLTWSFGRLHQNIAPKSVPHVQHDYFSSFNQFVALSLTLPSSNLKFPVEGKSVSWSSPCTSLCPLHSSPFELNHTPPEKNHSRFPLVFLITTPNAIPFVVAPFQLNKLNFPHRSLRWHSEASGKILKRP